jgi:hypothetical protein
MPSSVDDNRVEIHLYGSLQRAGERKKEPLRLDVRSTVPLRDVIERLGIPPDLVQLAMVNHRAVAADCPVRPRDRVSLFPREYVIFTDWKDFRRFGPDESSLELE